jgi:hypothetical protein
MPIAKSVGLPEAIPSTPPNNAYVLRVQYELSVANRTSTYTPDNLKSPHDQALLAGHKAALQALLPA